MIPALVSLPGSPWDVLPPGVYVATFEEIESRFAYNPRRRELYAGLVNASVLLAGAGCQTIALDGSYVSAKALPADYDACWDPKGMDFGKLDPIFADFENGRANQKARFGGEFFPSILMEVGSGRAFVDFFQVDRFTGGPKGILSITISRDEVVARRMKP